MFKGEIVIVVYFEWLLEGLAKGFNDGLNELVSQIMRIKAIVVFSFHMDHHLVSISGHSDAHYAGMGDFAFYAIGKKGGWRGNIDQMFTGHCKHPLLPLIHVVNLYHLR